MQRVVVIGARRRRQGIGEFVARWFADEGADVRGVVGTSEESATLAAANLWERYDIECRAYVDLEQALAVEQPDIVAICSPIEAHREQLATIAEAGIHCLCEKPMWWRDGPDVSREGLGSETETIVDAFLGRGLHLELVTQWPCTLPGFYELYPEVRGEPLERFEMLLAPISTETRAVVDAMPHVLSMLQSLSGCGEVRNAEARFEDPQRQALELQFDYCVRGFGDGEPSEGGPCEGGRGEGDERRVRVESRFVTCPDRPRPAAYAINGRRADRIIRLPDYVMELAGEGDRGPVTLEDPLKVLIREVIRRIESAPKPAATIRQLLIESITELEPLVNAARRPRTS